MILDPLPSPRSCPFDSPFMFLRSRYHGSMDSLKTSTAYAPAHLGFILSFVLQKKCDLSLRHGSKPRGRCKQTAYARPKSFRKQRFESIKGSNPFRPIFSSISSIHFPWANMAFDKGGDRQGFAIERDSSISNAYNASTS
jgi:hypothetical protein